MSAQAILTEVHCILEQCFGRMATGERMDLTLLNQLPIYGYLGYFKVFTFKMMNIFI